MWEALEGGSGAPVLLAHSLDDELAPAADVSRFADALRSRGRVVALLTWHSSPHVGHLRAHPAAYEAAARAWVADAAAHFRTRAIPATAPGEHATTPALLLARL